jgi:hypothetical protein
LPLNWFVALTVKGDLLINMQTDVKLVLKNFTKRYGKSGCVLSHVLGQCRTPSASSDPVHNYRDRNAEPFQENDRNPGTIGIKHKK